MPKIETPEKGDCLPEDNVINTALAALKDAGCVNKTLKNEQEKMMPDTYTKEQIENAKAQATFCVANGHLVPNKCGSILLSALSTAERERDAALARCAELEGGLVAAIKSIDEGGAHSVKRIRKMLIEVLDAIVSKKEG